MFYGSNVHATAAAAIFSVLASCRLHRIEPHHYLEELLRVMPYCYRSGWMMGERSSSVMVIVAVREGSTRDAHRGRCSPRTPHDAHHAAQPLRAA